MGSAGLITSGYICRGKYPCHVPSGVHHRCFLFHVWGPGDGREVDVMGMAFQLYSIQSHCAGKLNLSDDNCMPCCLGCYESWRVDSLVWVVKM